jgi:hypothetical protein
MKEPPVNVFTESIEEYDLPANGETPKDAQCGRDTTGDQP